MWGCLCVSVSVKSMRFFFFFLLLFSYSCPHYPLIIHEILKCSFCLWVDREWSFKTHWTKVILLLCHNLYLRRLSTLNLFLCVKWWGEKWRQLYLNNNKIIITTTTIRRRIKFSDFKKSDTFDDSKLSNKHVLDVSPCTAQAHFLRNRNYLVGREDVCLSRLAHKIE